MRCRDEVALGIDHETGAEAAQSHLDRRRASVGVT